MLRIRLIDRDSEIFTHIHTCIHMYTHAYAHTYLHTYVHVNVQTLHINSIDNMKNQLAARFTV